MVSKSELPTQLLFMWLQSKRDEKTNILIFHYFYQQVHGWDPQNENVNKGATGLQLQQVGIKNQITETNPLTER